MKLGDVEITISTNEAIIGAVVAITIMLMFVDVPKGSADIFKQGFGALIAWGAGFAMAKKEDKP